jgi:hypothetical protein
VLRPRYLAQAIVMASRVRGIHRRRTIGGLMHNGGYPVVTDVMLLG